MCRKLCAHVLPRRQFVSNFSTNAFAWPRWFSRTTLALAIYQKANHTHVPYSNIISHIETSDLPITSHHPSHLIIRHKIIWSPTDDASLCPIPPGRLPPAVCQPVHQGRGPDDSRVGCHMSPLLPDKDVGLRETDLAVGVGICRGRGSRLESWLIWASGELNLRLIFVG